MRAKLKRWFWCACFTGEYESSSASLAERDTPVLLEWLRGGDEPNVVHDFGWDPERWRAVTIRQQGHYRATIALSLVEHPRDFYTAAPLTPERIKAGNIDDHHVFPRGYLKRQGRESAVDSVLNHCLIDSSTNTRISKKAPSEYLKEIRAALGSGLDQVLASHLLPTGAPLSSDDFEEFLSWRLRRLNEALALATGSLIAVASERTEQRSETDLQLEGVELVLRRLIADTVGDEKILPAHVMGKMKERLTTNLRRNPGVDNGHYATLSGKLEFCDLRDLQDILTAKPLWPEFESRFASKEMLNLRFSQLAELRNRIRHSRALDEVTRKDGEAALMWFRQVLARA